MPSRAAKPPKPEDMLLRVIRVAEILVKGQDKTAEEVIEQKIDHAKVSQFQEQKTQT